MKKELGLKIRQEIKDAEDNLLKVVTTKLFDLVNSSTKISSMGNRYISVSLYDYISLEINNGYLKFVDEHLGRYHIDEPSDVFVDDLIDIINAEVEVRLEEEEKENRKKKQYDMAQDILNKIGYNIVTCGDCSEVLLHDTNDLDSEGTSNDIVCPSCEWESESCDFPDLFCL